MKEEENLEGIGGWLILIAIGIIISPIRFVILIMMTYPEIFSQGIWEALTTQGSDAYNPLWMPIIITELIINCGLVLVWCLLLLTLLQ